MIDPNAETVVSFTDVPRDLPRRRGGKRPHVSCIYRWTTAGCRGVILESMQVGGTRCASKEALARFIRRLASDDALPMRRPSARAPNGNAAEKAMRDLERAGV